MSKLVTFLQTHAMRGACQCGLCIDSDADAKNKQPTGHTADMIFFKVALSMPCSAKDFRDLVQAEFPHWLDGKEHNYLAMGGDIGDQGLALTAMGIGTILEVWDLLSPRTVLPGIDEDLAHEMAGMGYITVKSK